MPPSFPIFLGLIVYLGLTALTFVVSIPMLFFQPTRLIAKKVLVTVLVSFPCLIVTGLIFVIIFILPALLFSWLANNGYISKTPGIILAVMGLVVFVSLVVISGLCLWYFISKIIYCRLEKKPVLDFLENDKVFNVLRPYLPKFKLYHSSY
ncbi:MAG: hypothetical protein EOP45_04810 [Sphingobacteriaceae bacterium]|nr:MAG: hypothetical protein EOP45_04810 [Sphingobacteriaceae bacterium]